MRHINLTDVKSETVREVEILDVATQADGDKGRSLDVMTLSHVEVSKVHTGLGQQPADDTIRHPSSNTIHGNRHGLQLRHILNIN